MLTVFEQMVPPHRSRGYCRSKFGSIFLQSQGREPDVRQPFILRCYSLRAILSFSQEQWVQSYGSVPRWGTWLTY